MRILIVGGAGYIGTALTTGLAVQCEEVTVVDRLIHGHHHLHNLFVANWFNLRKGDVRDLTIKGDYDAVVNLASLTLPESARDPEQAGYVNRDAAIRLGEECDKLGIQYIFPSTCSNYGVKTDGYATEDDPLDPTSVYAQTKVDAEKALLKMDSENIAVLRFATAFGLGGMFRKDLILHEFIERAIYENNITLYGANFYRPLCHVDDIARAIAIVIRDGHYGVYNIGGTDLNFTKAQLANMISQETGCNITISSQTPDPRNYRVSFEKAKQELQFTPSIHPANEIVRIIDAMKQGVL